jgi:hypothetical protein
MTRTAFAVTWDYRCPFARNAHDHLLTALEGGADWDVTFLPFSLGQAHVEEGGIDVWDRPDTDSGLYGLQAAVAVQTLFPDRFLAVHRALFEHRHEHGGQLRTADDVLPVLASGGIDTTAVAEEIASGRPLETVRQLHTSYAKTHDVWGVPTFIVGDQAAFVRLMNRAEGDAELARSTIGRVVDLLSWPELNEFKHTSIPR